VALAHQLLKLQRCGMLIRELRDRLLVLPVHIRLARIRNLRPHNTTVLLPRDHRCALFPYALTIQGYDLQDNGRRPSMPTPAYERPNYSRGNSPAPPAPYGGYNESHEDFRQGYGTEETYPLTAYAQHPMTPGSPYEGFEGDTGNS
jgi:hypothetical protein